jgi:hypothetical protein
MSQLKDRKAFARFVVQLFFGEVLSKVVSRCFRFTRACGLPLWRHMWLPSSPTDTKVLSTPHHIQTPKNVLKEQKDDLLDRA